MYLWIWWAGRKNQAYAPIRTLLIATVVVMILILPFTVYNYTRFQRFVLLNTNAGFAFFWGNHPIHGDKFIVAREMENYQVLIPDDLVGLDEAALDQALLKRGLEFILADPVRYMKLSLSRIPVYFNFWPDPESNALSNITRVGSFGVYLPFFLAGIFLWMKGQRRKGWAQALASPGALLALFAIIYSAVHILTWTLVRYRLPVDAALIPFAAVAVARLFGVKDP
jgi:hypothetical protein